MSQCTPEPRDVMADDSISNTNVPVLTGFSLDSKVSSYDHGFPKSTSICIGADIESVVAGVLGPTC